MLKIISAIPTALEIRLEFHIYLNPSYGVMKQSFFLPSLSFPPVAASAHTHCWFSVLIDLVLTEYQHAVNTVHMFIHLVLTIVPEVKPNHPLRKRKLGFSKVYNLNGKAGFELGHHTEG